MVCVIHVDVVNGEGKKKGTPARKRGRTENGSIWVKIRLLIVPLAGEGKENKQKEKKKEKKSKRCDSQ